MTRLEAIRIVADAIYAAGIDAEIGAEALVALGVSAGDYFTAIPEARAVHS